MKKIIASMHVTLDGFTAGPNGEMDWINLPDGLFDFVGKMTDAADTALYGRVTYEMMNQYWPTAGDKPDASKHAKEHSAWYNKVMKIVLSKTLSPAGLKNTHVISDSIPTNITNLKKEGGTNIMIFGSPSVVQTLFNNDLIDELWLFVNPVVIGKGIPLFKGATENKKLKLLENKVFGEVIGLHYERAIN